MADQKQQICWKMKLAFEESAVEEIEQIKNSLLVTAKGLSISKLVAMFLCRNVFSNEIQTSTKLIFLLNFTDSDFEAIKFYLQQFLEKPATQLQKLTSTENLSTKRIDLFLKGGVFFVSLKCLTLDILTKRLSTSIITGFLIKSSKQKDNNVQEEFLSQILLKDNPNAFIKYFCDKPGNIMKISDQDVEIALKNLKIQSLILYPRIRNQVKQSLDTISSLKVHEIQVEMTARQQQMHDILIQLLQVCLEELKKQLSQNKNIDKSLLEEFTIENLIYKQLFSMLRGTLGKKGKNIGAKSRALLKDISNIKKLLWLLLNNDAIHFYQIIQELRYDDNYDTFTIFRFCDEQTFQLVDSLTSLAKQRNYTIKLKEQTAFRRMKKKENSHQGISSEAKLYKRGGEFWQNFKKDAFIKIEGLEQLHSQYALQLEIEESPKFSAIIQILKEIEKDFLRSPEFIAYQHKIMKFNDENDSQEDYLLEEKQTKQISGQKQSNLNLSEFKNKILLVLKSQKQQQQITQLLKEFFYKKFQTSSYYENQFYKFLTSFKEWQKRKESLNHMRKGNQQLLELLLLQKMTYQLENRLYSNQCIDNKKRNREQMEKENQSVNENSDEFDGAILENLIHCYDLHVLAASSQTEYSEIEVKLRELQPNHIILFEPQLDFMRQIEQYCAEKEQISKLMKEIHVYLPLYDQSSEIFQYMKIIEQEKIQFQKLIQIKSKSYFVQEAGNILQQEKNTLSLMNNHLTNDSARHIIAVDSREFSSQTPLQLYKCGFWLIPLVLTVGDYVLSDEICIERKSVNTGDLFESFKSGRLLTQITNMHRYYKKPILLIEFDDNEEFKLNDFSSDHIFGGDVTPSSIISKLSLLTLHFPNLTIIWSKSAQQTADIFLSLKNTQASYSKDPDLQKIAKIGKIGDTEKFDLEKEENEEDEFNQFLPIEFLKKLPGVDSNNIYNIVKKVRNIVELTKMDETQLASLINPKSAKDLKQFLDSDIRIQSTFFKAT